MNIIERLGITPGPWEVTGSDDQFVKTGMEGENKDMIIGEFWGRSMLGLPESKPNTRLVSSCTEMLERDIKFIAKLEGFITESTSMSFSKEDQFWYDQRIEGIKTALKWFDFSPDEKGSGKTWEVLKGILNE